MNRIALALAVLGSPGLLLLPLTSTSQLVPFAVAIGVTGLGALVAIGGAATSRPRVHGGGVALAIVGASLTGISLSTPMLALGVASATLLVASLNLHLVLPQEGGGVTLVFAAVLSAGVVAGLALLVGRFSRWLGGGGVDATGGVTAWLVLVAAVTWGFLRWVQEAQPR